MSISKSQRDCQHTKIGYQKMSKVVYTTKFWIINNSFSTTKNWLSTQTARRGSLGESTFYLTVQNTFRWKFSIFVPVLIFIGNSLGFAIQLMEKGWYLRFVFWCNFVTIANRPNVIIKISTRVLNDWFKRYFLFLSCINRIASFRAMG